MYKITQIAIPYFTRGKFALFRHPSFAPDILEDVIWVASLTEKIVKLSFYKYIHQHISKQER